MKTIIHHLLAIAALYIASTICVSAGGITDAIANADAVVVGSIATRLESSDNVSFDIDVLRVLKGQSIPPVIHVNHPWNRIGLISPNAPTNFSVAILGIWFLKANGTSAFDVLAVGGPDGILPALFLRAVSTLPPSYQYPPGTGISDMVVFEVAAGVESSGRSPEVLLYAVESLNTSAVLTVLSDFSNSKIAALSSVGLAGLLERAQQGSIARLGQLWPSISQDPSRTYVLSALRDSFRDATPAGVQQLAALAGQSTSSPDLRTAAISALAAIHTREALPFLASLLTSVDVTERLKGVFGLSSFANGCVPQTPDNVVSMAYLQFPESAPYQTADTVANFAFQQEPDDQEAAVISFWSSWWSDHPELH